ncbi:phosphoketolase family protein [Pediococcus claussenii]|uniref:Probable phosphoketolase n=1 Tax=Pediococcus claussenii (strain ATCC BAA-344 / DSM 14800 / JCM 18046 / KCTC 3811 / LMG 21948 / P06) TaxID=701521 RepID=G8PF37_PEDCP|nr:phosphoketolase family protein [Pediococcus claussenii]AEV95716.1 xylulose-5-phosphate phosphoketolase [Pediococcus claussenii ATCC BAA-344]KRN20050.1 xpkA protein [Pediococcus claussenii]
MTDYSSKEYFDNLTKFWRAANYLSVGQLYLKDNPLLKRDLEENDVKVHPIGHWGTIPGQNFLYAHLNRVINKYNVNMFYIEGPGHGGQVMVSNSYLDGSYTETYPAITQDEEGMKKLFKQFSWPGGVASHAAPVTPGSIHEGGELGYSLAHGVGAILDNPDQIAAVVIGDGEAETGPLAASWNHNRFINPINDGAVLPILDINGYKLSNPTLTSRMSDGDLAEFFKSLHWDPMFVEGDDAEKMNPEMAKVMDKTVEKIQAIQKNARDNNDTTLPDWPVIVFRSPKGWTGPKTWDGKVIEGTFRAHQIPIPVDQADMQHSDSLVKWLRSYGPDDLFNEDGSVKAEIAAIAPKGKKRMAANPITNGGIDPKDLSLPDYRDYAVDVSKRGVTEKQDMIVWSDYLRDVVKKNPTNFRMFGPDETMSNRLYGLFEATNRQWLDPIKKDWDEALAPAGRILDSQLSEHSAEAWLEAYTLTGRHGIFTSYEAFLRVVDSMITQHFKWIRKADELEWRHDYPSLNIVSTSTSFQQDHNGYTHQDPGILTHLAEKKPEFIREYLPADANSLLAVSPKIMNDRQKVNLLITSKQPRPQFYSIDEAEELVDKGLGIIDWASTDNGKEPDVVFAAAGTEPNMESLAAINILHDQFPDLKIRFINVIDLLKLQSPKLNSHGISDEEFDHYFTKDKPVIFAFHGFEDLIRSIFFDRHNHNLHVHGYREEGDITTPFDMRVLNELDRFHLAQDAINSIPDYDEKGSEFVQEMDNELEKHYQYIRDNGDDLPEVKNWVWKDLK